MLTNHLSLFPFLHYCESDAARRILIFSVLISCLHDQAEVIMCSSNKKCCLFRGIVFVQYEAFACSHNHYHCWNSNDEACSRKEHAAGQVPDAILNATVGANVVD